MIGDKKRVSIGIDGNEANVAKRVGSNAYAFELIKAMYELDTTSKYTVYLKDTPQADMPPERDNWKYRVLVPKKLWTQWRLPLDLFLNHPRPQVFFSPGHYAPRFAPIPRVVSIMDLAFLHFPNLFLKFKRGTAQLEQWTAYSVKNAAHIIAISQATKRDVVSSFHVSPERISVAYPGVDINYFKPQSGAVVAAVRQKYNLAKHYILYVGTIQPRKNLVRLLHAFEQLPPKYKQYQLVIAGQTGWLSEDFVKALEASHQKQRVRLTGFVETADLPALYSGASCACLVGLFEGFGMPPAEALACGTIPIVSNTSSLPEVVGDAGIIVDPYSVKSISHGMMSAISLPEEKRQRLLKIGAEHIKQFDWSAAAATVIKALYDVALQR